MTKPYEILELILSSDDLPFPLRLVDSREYNNYMFTMISLGENAFSFRHEAIIYKMPEPCELALYPDAPGIYKKITLTNLPSDCILVTPWNHIVEMQNDTDEYMAKDGSMIARSEIYFESF